MTASEGLKMVEYAKEAYGVFGTSLYDPKSCQSIVDQVKKLDSWEGAEIRLRTDGNNYHSVARPEIRSAGISTLTDDSEILQEFNAKMDRIVKPLVSQIWRVDLRDHSEAQIIRYLPGGHYRPHRDAGFDLQDRYFTVVCYLNDDFEGGNTWFPDLNYRAVPKCGKAILFSSKYLHCAQPVITGEKYVVVSWIRGPAPIRWI